LAMAVRVRPQKHSASFPKDPNPNTLNHLESCTVAAPDFAETNS